MERYKILVLDNFEEYFFKDLREYADVIKAASITGLEDSLQEIDILVVRSNSKVDKELVDKMPRMKLVITATHGEDHIDKVYLKEKNIDYYNAPVQTFYVAQGAIAAMLALNTRLVEGDRSMKNGKWRKNDLVGSSLFNKNLGIIGYGRIGKEVAKLALSFGMKVCAYDPYVKTADANVTLCGLDELLKESDIVSIHLPLTDETKGLIGKKEFEMMKKGAFFVNLSRGGIVDEKALLEALKTGRLKGCALDVYSEEPPFKKIVLQELIKLENVIATPHSIAQTEEAIRDKGNRVIEIIEKFYEKQKNIVKATKTSVKK